MRELSFSAPLWTEGVDILAAFVVCVRVPFCLSVCVYGERAYILAGSSLYRWSSSRWINHRKFLPLSKLALLREKTACPPLHPPSQPSSPSLCSLPLPLVNPSDSSPAHPFTTLPIASPRREVEQAKLVESAHAQSFFLGFSCRGRARPEQSNGKQ